MTNLFENIKAKNEVQGKKLKVKVSEMAIKFSYGNLKLQDNDKVSFIQWNMSAVVTCPYRTELCEKNCYAKKAERIYPSTRERRHTHYMASQQEWFVEAMIEQIEWELSRKKNVGKKILFRIHESGDFYSYEYTKKWVEIANHFKGRNIVFMAYTKSLPFLKMVFKEFGDNNVNITFKSSIWADTKEKFAKLTNELNMTVFTALTKEEFKSKDYSDYFKCPASETVNTSTCGTCTMCYQGNKNVAIEIH